VFRTSRLVLGALSVAIVAAATAVVTSHLAGADTAVTHHEFQVDCSFVNRLSDDPIVFPASPVRRTTTRSSATSPPTPSPPARPCWPPRPTRA
jgi:hypothetical protein